MTEKQAKALIDLKEWCHRYDASILVDFDGGDPLVAIEFVTGENDLGERTFSCLCFDEINEQEPRFNVVVFEENEQ